MAVQNVKISQKAAASAALAAAIREDSDVDWAAYSEDITVYEISNEGVQLPEQQQFDEFSKLHEEEDLVPLASNAQH